MVMKRETIVLDYRFFSIGVKEKHDFVCLFHFHLVRLLKSGSKFYDYLWIETSSIGQIAEEWFIKRSHVIV